MEVKNPDVTPSKNHPVIKFLIAAIIFILIIFIAILLSNYITEKLKKNQDNSKSFLDLINPKFKILNKDAQIGVGIWLLAGITFIILIFLYIVKYTAQRLAR